MRASRTDLFRLVDRQSCFCTRSIARLYMLEILDSWIMWICNANSKKVLTGGLRIEFVRSAWNETIPLTLVFR